MPRKKQQKSHEQQTAENYFPVKETDIKYAVEKPVKSLPELEMVGKIGKSKKKYVNKKKSSSKKDSKGGRATSRERTSNPMTSGVGSRVGKPYEPPKISLKKNGYELIITEKPQAALKISSALGSSIKRNLHGVPYYELDRQGKKIIVACAVGHLFTLKQDSNNSLPVFDIKWVPNFLVKKADFTKKYYDTLLSLVKNAGTITIATDYDIEGEVIGLNVIRFICNQQDANRMKFSTLTDKELNNAYEKKSKTLDWGQAIAGETRHYLDWFYGINLSRALMNAIKTTGRFKIMSIGRVQGPTLNLIVQKEREIQKFKPTPYWQVLINVKQEKIELELKYNKDITKKAELSKFENLKGKEAYAETKKSQQKIQPQEPFKLTTLQTEAYKFFGITPSRTLQIAQSLYLAGLISYPRTSSQKLPDSIGYKEILNKLAKQYKAENLIKRNKPVEGSKSDPAHPSIYPTGQAGTMNSDEEKVYNLIVKRFISLFCEDAIINNKTIRAEIELDKTGNDKLINKKLKDISKQLNKVGLTDNKLELGGEQLHDVASKTGVGLGVEDNQKKEKLVFSTRGSEIVNKGWMNIYPAKINEKEIPDLNGKVKIINVRNEEKETQPPRRYSQASIISELEKRNLGTKCLTGNTKVVFNGELIKIEDLFNSGKKYTKKNNTKIRKINGKIISFLEKEKCPIITSPSFISKRKLKENESIIQIETDSSIINLTEDHLIYVLKDNKIQQIKSKELRLSDNMIGIIKHLKYGDIITNQSIFDKNFKEIKNEILHKFSQKNSRGIKKDCLPLRWSDSLAWVLGYYYGDGSYSNPKYNGSHQVCFTTTEKKALSLLKENIKNIFGIEPYAYNLGNKYKVNCNSVMSYFLAKCFPEIEGKNILSIPNKFMGDFLRGFFDADGNVHLRPKEIKKIRGIKCNSFDTPRVKITLANKKLIEWISKMLKELKIENKINKNISTCNGKKFDCWTILISGRDKIEKFAYKIGFSNYKEDLLYKGLKCDSWKYKVLKNSAKICLILNKNSLKIEELEEESLIQKYELRVALKRLNKLGIVTKKRYTNRNKNIYSLINKSTEFIDHCMKLLYKKNVFGVYNIPINKINKKQYLGYVYDISVEKESPNFITEGHILVHNSTRANILETLYDRDYIREKSIEATPFGISLINSLEKYSPIIINEKLTRHFEKEMDAIISSKKEQKEKEDKIIDEAKETITKIVKDMKENEKKIGEELVEANNQIIEQQRQENTLTKCPKCGKGNLRVLYNKNFKRYFIGCSNYPECKTTYSLPPGLIKNQNKICEYCQFPKLLRIQKAKRPWEFCFNPECESRKQKEQ